MDVLNVLFVVMLVAALWQPDSVRLLAALCFVMFTVTHGALFSDLDGGLYYATAALFDLLIIIFLSMINPIPRMVVTLQTICVVSIGVNFVGWGIWTQYLPPTAYDKAFVVIYLWAIWALLRRNEVDVGRMGDTTVRGRGAWILRSFGSRSIHQSKDESKI